MAEIDEDVTVLGTDVNFLFDEQIIQDERLLNLETTSDGATIELAQINDEIEGFLLCILLSANHAFYLNKFSLCTINLTKTEKKMN